MALALYQYPGALHVHSLYSDGSGTLGEIALAGRTAGLRWIIMTDHHPEVEPALRPEYERWHRNFSLLLQQERWYGDLALIIGYELTPQNNHYLVVDYPHLIGNEVPPAEFVRRIAEGGGMGFVAHPDERNPPGRLPDHPPIPWEDWTIRGFTGIEIWNWMSVWMEGATKANSVYKVTFKHDGIFGPTERTLKWWDDLNRTGRVVATGGTDAHAVKKKLGPLTLTIFPYEELFRTLTNYLVLRQPLSDDLETCKQQVYTALREGRSFIANRHFGDGDGLAFIAEQADGEYTIGDTVPPGHSTEFRVVSPQGGNITLLRDGEILADAVGTRLAYTTKEPGAYRVEIRRGTEPWVFTNPIFVRDDGTGTGSAGATTEAVRNAREDTEGAQRS